jgi:hypothetical protein
LNTTKVEEWWEVENEDHNLFSALNNNSIFLKHANIDNSKLHSCYEYKLIDKRTGSLIKTNEFCYPSIIVTGLRKCATSALYQLLAQYPNVEAYSHKENCPYLDYNSIIEYFDSLPNSVYHGEIILDGCVHLQGNIKIRKILRFPNAFYLVSYN